MPWTRRFNSRIEASLVVLMVKVSLSEGERICTVNESEDADSIKTECASASIKKKKRKEASGGA